MTTSQNRLCRIFESQLRLIDIKDVSIEAKVDSMGILAEPVQVVMSDLRNLETMKSARLDLIAVFNSDHRLIKGVEQAFGEYNMSGDEKLDDIISQIDRLEKRDLYTPIEQGNCQTSCQFGYG